MEHYNQSSNDADIVRWCCWEGYRQKYELFLVRTDLHSHDTEWFVQNSCILLIVERGVGPLKCLHVLAPPAELAFITRFGQQISKKERNMVYLLFIVPRILGCSQSDGLSDTRVTFLEKKSLIPPSNKPIPAMIIPKTNQQFHLPWLGINSNKRINVKRMGLLSIALLRFKVCSSSWQGMGRSITNPWRELPQ